MVLQLDGNFFQLLSFNSQKYVLVLVESAATTSGTLNDPAIVRNPFLTPVDEQVSSTAQTPPDDAVRLRGLRPESQAAALDNVQGNTAKEVDMEKETFVILQSNNNSYENEKEIQDSLENRYRIVSQRMGDAQISQTKQLLDNEADRDQNLHNVLEKLGGTNIVMLEIHLKNMTADQQVQPEATVTFLIEYPEGSDINSSFRFLYKGIIIKHNKTEPTYTKTSLFLCEKRRFFMARTEKGGNIFKLAGPGGLAFFHLIKKEVSKWPMKK